MTVYSNVKQCLVSLNGIKAQLSNFALNSQDEKAQQSYVVSREIKKDLQTRTAELEFMEPQYKPS